MKYGMSLVLLAVMSAPLAALAGDDKSATTDEQLGQMQKRLQLTDEQVAEMQQIRDDGGTRKDMRSVLNDEQKAQAKKLKQNRKKPGDAKSKPASPSAGDAEA
tara:strand:+ start:27242 stop:27550 length:309 start_codon:yes stop_codon:yes gene_type:complete